LGPRERLKQRYSGAREGSGDNADAIRMLRSDKPEERLQAVLTLAGSDDPNAVTHLLSAAADSDLRVRVKAINELGNRRASEATPVLVQQLFLRETTPVVHQRVLAALGKIGDTVATQPICEFLSRDLDPSTRGSAIFALGEIGDDAALDVLSDVVARGDPTTSRLADEAVRKIKHQTQAPVEIPMLSGDRAR
jgi:HEAT repeat protein